MPPPTSASRASAAPRRPHPGLCPLAGAIPEISAASRTLKLNGAHKANNMFSVRGGRGRGATRPEEGVCSSVVPSSRWAVGRRHLYCTCICSKARRVWPGAGKGRPLRAGAQIQQKFPPPVSDARSLMLGSGPACCGRAPCHNVSEGNHHPETPGSTSRRHACNMAVFHLPHLKFHVFPIVFCF